MLVVKVKGLTDGQGKRGEGESGKSCQCAFCSLICNEQLIKWLEPHGSEVLERQESVIEPSSLVTLSDSSFQ